MSIKIYLEKRDCFKYPSSDKYFSPHIHYPEYPFPADTLASEKNEVYDMVRTSLFGLGLDKEHYGTSQWNPLGVYVQPNSRILIKPNFVHHVNPIGGLDCTVTHPSIIRCIIDYCVIAGASSIEVGDAPIQDCNFEELMNTHGYKAMFSFFKERNITLKVTDFRRTISKVSAYGIYSQQKNINSEINQTVEFDLKNLSNFSGLSDNQRFRIANYYDININSRHNKDHHKYLVTKSIIDADLIINLPKPKTHRFAGLTGAQKNFIGICSDKEYLPHYRIGTPDNGGDETNHATKLTPFFSLLNQQRCKYIEKQNYIMQFFYKLLMGLIRWMGKIIKQETLFSIGQWYGNDTIWRTILDLNYILLYGNEDGMLCLDSIPRHILTIGDLIIAGEKSGPLEPSPKPLGIILASDNCAVFDYVFCKIAGFDGNIIPTIKRSINNQYLISDSLSNIYLQSNLNEYNNISLKDILFPNDWHFRPNPTWNDVLK
jgi:uncharacterized protein (DUF362 family)